MDSVVLETESVLFTSCCVTCRFAVLKPMVFKLAGEGDTAVDSQLGPGLLKQRPLGHMYPAPAGVRLWCGINIIFFFGWAID